MKTARIVMFVLLVWAVPAGAAVITVNEAVPGGCTLHDAIRAADADAPRGDCPAGSGGDTIRIASPQTVLLDSALPTINTVIVIEPDDGGRRRVMRNRDGDPPAPNFRIFDVNNGHLVLDRIDVDAGRLEGILDGGGAGIRVRDGALGLVDAVLIDNFLLNTNTGGAAILSRNSIVEIVGSSVTDNRALNQPGGGPQVHAAGINALDSVISIRDSLLGRNSTGFAVQPRAMHKFHNSLLTVERSRFDERFAGLLFLFENSSDGLFVNSTLSPGTDFVEIQASTLTLVNSTVDGYDFLSDTGDGVVNFINTIHRGDCGPGVSVNSVTSSLFTEGTCTGIVTPPGDLLLLTHADNGGPTETNALHPLSVAVNAASPADCPDEDQRGEPRTASECDIGAFELGTDADIQISAVMGTPPPYYVGQQVEIDLNVYNDGPAIAHFVGVDALLQNATLVSVDGACQSLPCELFALSPGGDFETVTLTLEPLNSGSNDFSVLAEAFPGSNAIYQETDPSNNESSLNRDLDPAADVSVTKTLLTPGPYGPGQSISYEIVVENHGPVMATSVVMEDSPEGLTIDGISNCIGPTAGPCSFVSIPAGATETLVASAIITASAFDNVAEVTADQVDPMLDNNRDDRQNGGHTDDDADVGLQMDKLTSAPHYSGQTVEYFIRVANEGPDAATGVNLDFDHDPWFVPFNVIGDCGITILPCEIGNLASGTFEEVIIQGFLASAGSVTVSAHVEADQNDDDLSNNDASDGFTSNQTSDVSVSLTPVTPPPYHVDSPVVYTLTVVNLGPDVADNVLIDLVSDNLVIDSVLGGQCLALPCTLETLSGFNEDIQVVAFPQAIGSFDMSANADADQYDPVPANNTDGEGNGGQANAPLADYILADSFETFFD